MTIEQKRLKMISTMCNADSKGISIMWDKLHEKSKKTETNGSKNLTDKDIAHAFMRVIPELFGDDIMFSALASVICLSVIEDLFKED